ncbi:MAG: glycosyltransferase family 2 protein [Chloroflexi bacterium]|nr:glycosyltransferase family 2 protein [Chloroflexota bacterium]
MRTSNLGLSLSIIIISWNTRDLLAKCLASVYNPRPAASFEVIVVDNASSDGSPEMVKTQFPQVRILENSQNLGFARANNQAIRASQGRYILLLNSDTIVTPHAVQMLLDCMQTHPQAGVCGPMLINANATFQASFNDFPNLFTEIIHLLGVAPRLLSRSYPSYELTDSRQLRAVDWVGGACFMIRRACIDQVGLLDESFIMYGEEVDWCYRIRQHGWEVIYQPDARIIHLGGQSALRVPAWKYLQLQRGKVLFFRKHYGPIATAILVNLIRATNLMKAGSFFIITHLPAPLHMPRSDKYWRTYWNTAWSTL